MRESLRKISLIGLYTAGVLLAINIGNCIKNTWQLKWQDHMEASRVTGISSYERYYKDPDGFRRIEIYPELSSLTGRFELYCDSNSDGIVDQIISLKSNCAEQLIRDKDYNTHQKEFNKADKKLQDPIKYYRM